MTMPSEPGRAAEWSVVRDVRVTSSMPLPKSWYRVTIDGLTTGETVELRINFGLGFVGHHSVRATAEGGEAILFVRLFKTAVGVQLLRPANAPSGGLPSVRFARLSFLDVSRRRLVEQAHLLVRRLANRGPASSPHDRPRRLWGWRGLEAFPAELKPNGQTSYALWRQVHRRQVPQPARPLDDWVLILDCRKSEPAEQCLAAFTAAAAYVGARTFVLRREIATSNVPDIAPGATWVVLAEADVVMDRDCVAILGAMAEPAAVIYSDSDRIDGQGRRSCPTLRTQFSPERHMAEDCLGGVVAFRADAAPAGSADEFTRHALSRAIAESHGPKAFVHVPIVTYAQPRAPASILVVDRPNRPEWAGTATIIVPTRNRADLLRACIDSVMAKTSPGKFEIIIHDNGSDDPSTLQLLAAYAEQRTIRVLRDELPFNFSRINNDAAAVAGGELLVFLNNDTEIVSPNWLERLAEVATEPSVGCVGPLMLARDGTIQHAGLLTGPGGIAAHLHAGLFPDEVDPMLPLVRRDVSAVTGACLAIQKNKFVAAGSFDAAGLPVAFNDIDLCLRLEQAGFRNVLVPDAALIHLGSATREDDDFTSGSERFRAEFRLMRNRWGSRLDFDPYFPELMRLAPSGPQLRLA